MVSLAFLKLIEGRALGEASCLLNKVLITPAIMCCLLLCMMARKCHCSCVAKVRAMASRGLVLADCGLLLANVFWVK